MGDTVATFLGCQDAIATAAATCPDCGRTGTVPVSTEVVVHKTILCTDCADLKVAAATRADSASGEQASEGREVAVSHVGASQGNVAQSSPLEDRLASEVRDALEWRDGPDFVLPPPGFKGTADEFWAADHVHDDICDPSSPVGDKSQPNRPETDPAQRWHRCWLCGARRNENVLFLSREDHDWACVDSVSCRQGRDQEAALAWIAAKAQEWAESETPPERKATMLLLADVARTANPPIAVNEPCADACGRPAEIILLYPTKHVSKCINCFLIAAMKRPCSICGQHITEAITRALDEQRKPNTIGVCMSCLYKADQAQRN